VLGRDGRVSRPVVSQALKRFQDRGWLECDHEGYRILDREALAVQSREGLDG